MAFRKLYASEIDARVSTINKNGCSLLLYKDARVDQNILDETFGIFGWQRSHQLIGDRLYCTVSVWDEKKQMWISKQDVGTESYTEKEKGQASDSFKRACFNLGIGRELYTAPFIWVPADKVSITERDGRYTTTDRFEVESIGYGEDGNINQITIRNTKKGIIAYQCEKNEKILSAKITEKDIKALQAKITQKGVKTESVCKRYSVNDISELTFSQFTQAMATLEKQEDKA
jgi:hypothetical protein